MAAPAATSAITAAQPTAGDPTITLSFTHSGTNLHRLQLLRRRTGSTDPWRSVALGPKADFFVSGTTYMFTIGGLAGYTYAVRGLSSAGEVSTGNPTVAPTIDVDGVWLLPFNGYSLVTASKAWIGTNTPDYERELSSALFTVFDRESEISQLGVLHLEKGVISGDIMDRFSKTADQWLEKLEDLVKHQRRWNVYMVTPRKHRRVELGSISVASKIMGGPAWGVSVPYREL